MKLTLIRLLFREDYTIGNLFVNDEYFCDTLEDRVREEKIKDKTAIPSGEYDVSMTMSNRFKRVLPLVNNVKGFTGIRFHRGNTQKDTSGCILVGEQSGAQLINSTKYEKRLVNLLKDSKYNKLTII